MTVLGRERLFEEIRGRRLVVSPLFYREQVGAASIDLRVGNVVLMVRSRGASHVDPSRAKAVALFGEPHDVAHGRQQKHQRYEIPFKEPFLLHPGSLALVPTLEWVRLPGNLIGQVTARSTWAREGLSIATATLIEPSYEGIITLELANLGEIPIALYPGMSIAQIAFAEVGGHTGREGKGQFLLSLEPSQGRIAPTGDFPFIPLPPSKR